MKFKLSKKILTVLFCLMSVMAILCFVGCGEKAGGSTTDGGDPSTGDNGGNGGNGGSGGDSGSDYKPSIEIKLDASESVIQTTRPNTASSPIISDYDLSTLYTKKFEAEKNPEYDSRTEALDNIFNPDVLGQTVLVFDRSEWNKHLDYCAHDLSHEESVKVKGFYFTKDEKEWFFNDIGFRIRGNTSRTSPQWGRGAGEKNYVQAHFALDFEEWIPKGEDKKLAKSMKGVILKRFKTDSTYSREVYAYNLFRQNGIWIAPRAAYTRLIIQIDDGDGSFETIDYGIYAMIEEIKKQFLKERTTKTGGFLKENKGNLWKCLYKKDGSDFVKNNAWSIGEEDVSFTFADEDRTIIKDSTNTTYDYDYKGDNDLIEDGKPQIEKFMEELNNLPDCTDGKNDAADKEKITKFYNEKMAGDLFLRTYAINVILGMWDDYWVNKNNFYFYFDTDGKAYFIPYDYDNCLGTNGCGVDAGTQNPLVWGSLTDGSRPLIQKILQVPEFMDLYKKYLDEYSNEDSFFDDDKSIAQIKKWHEMIEPFIEGSKDLLLFPIDNGHYDTTPYIADEPAYWSGPYIQYTIYTPGELNFFTVRQAAIKNARISSDNLLTLDAGKGYFYMGEGKEPVKNLYYTFTTGDKLGEILERNGFKKWCVFDDYDEIDEYGFRYGYKTENGEYYYPDWFINSEYTFVYENTPIYESTTLNTSYSKMHEVTLDFNDVEYNNKTSTKQMIPEGFIITNFTNSILSGEIDDKIFTGWAYDQDGIYIADRLYLDKLEDDTLYAVWLDPSKLPYYFNKDNVTFIFRPNDYYVNSSEINSVHLMSDFTEARWDYFSEVNKLTKDTDGNYSITLNTNDIYGKSPTFKFRVNEDGWFGGDELRYRLPSKYLSGQYNDFKLVFPE